MPAAGSAACGGASPRLDREVLSRAPGDVLRWPVLGDERLLSGLICQIYWAGGPLTGLFGQVYGQSSSDRTVRQPYRSGVL